MLELLQLPGEGVGGGGGGRMTGVVMPEIVEETVLVKGGGAGSKISSNIITTYITQIKICTISQPSSRVLHSTYSTITSD